MNNTLLRGCVFSVLLGVGALGPKLVYAYHITCTNQTMTDLNFGDVDPQSTQRDFTATFSTSCYNDAPITRRSATICLSIGQARQMTNGSATLNFQLYQDPSRSIIWGSQFSGPHAPLMIKIQLGGYQTQQINATLYGRVLANQTAVVPGMYSKLFPGGNEARMTVEAPILDVAPPASCQNNPTASRYFPFTVSANVIEKCRVTTNSLDFGTSHGLLKTAVTASTNLDVQCSVGTAYHVSLNAGLNGEGDVNARKMVSGANSVKYQLYRDPSRTQVWGDIIGSNTIPGIGDGINSQNLTVYGKVPAQITPPAGNYNDTVTVTVTY